MSRTVSSMSTALDLACYSDVRANADLTKLSDGSGAPEMARVEVPTLRARTDEAIDGNGTRRTQAFAGLCPQLVEADIRLKKADSGFDVVDGARSRRRIAVR